MAIARRLSARLRRRGARVGRHARAAAFAVAIGLIVAAAEIVFRLVVEWVSGQTLGAVAGDVWRAAAAAPGWLIVATTTCGGLICGLIANRFMPNGQPVGIAQAIEAAALRGGRMSLRVGLIGAGLNAFALGCGASAGREGPVVHLGASIAAWTARIFRFDRGMARTLLGCGAAAAVAAAFNAPLAGSLFAAEVVLGHYALGAFAPIVLSAVGATILSRAWYGDFPAFTIPQVGEIQSALEFPAFVLLGLVAALVAVAFALGAETVRAQAVRAKLPIWARPAVAGFAVGIVGLSLPQVLGVGYEATDEALLGAFSLQMLVAILIAKLICSSLCIGLGFGNGVFGPALVLGAMTGCAFGMIAVSAVPPAYASPVVAYGVVGMAAVSAAILNAPVSTILIVFEMTGDYGLTIAVMTGVVVATLGAQLALGRSFFHRQLRAQGIDVTDGAAAAELAERVVGDVLSAPAPQTFATTPAENLRQRIAYESAGAIFVVGSDGKLLGEITLHDLAAYDDPDSPDFGRIAGKTAGAVARRPAAEFQLRTPLTVAAARCQASHETIFPVVYADDDRRLAGYVWGVDVIRAYVSALEAMRRAERSGEV
ncbi:MAG: chloride channel protein [Pseudomonadota bacterium]